MVSLVFTSPPLHGGGNVVVLHAQIVTMKSGIAQLVVTICSVLRRRGVDTRIATDLLSMGWGDQYDVAVLVSPDRDFIPVVEFLETRSIKVVHGAFQSVAAELSQACWANIDVSSLREQFRRAV